MCIILSVVNICVNGLTGIQGISQAIKKLSMPLVIVEDVDSSISSQITLLSRCESLANVVNALVSKYILYKSFVL